MHEKTMSGKRVYNGLILNIDVLDVELENGRRSKREIVQHGVSVAIVARLLDGHFVFIRQFRKPLERICFEVVAGSRDPGESSEGAAIRELREETGYAAQSLEAMGSIFPSVGYCTERIDVFFVEAGGKKGTTSLDEDERIETVLAAETEIDQRIQSGKISDAKTLSAWMLYKTRISGTC